MRCLYNYASCIFTPPLGTRIFCAVVVIGDFRWSSRAPTPGTDGVYEVAAAEIKRLPSSPSVEFPARTFAYEIADSVTIALTITPEGKVKKAKAVSGKIDSLKEAAEKTVKKWAFQPYLVNGTPVPIRTEIVVDFDNTLTVTETRKVMSPCTWMRRPHVHSS